MTLSIMNKQQQQDEGDDFTSSEAWFEGGRRVHFDRTQKLIVGTANANSVAVYERVRLPMYSSTLPHKDTRWSTFLPGFPSGSYGFAKVDRILEEHQNLKTPRLYVEYVGQGDSDKPSSKTYPYSTTERADLVEAQWRSHGVRRTVIVSLDYSSSVLMELLRRQSECSSSSSSSAFTKIEHILMINGGDLFTAAATTTRESSATTQKHLRRSSSSSSSTPVFKKSTLGRMSLAMAQRSNIICDALIKPLYSKSYTDENRKLMKRELRETVKAVRRRQGAFVLSGGAGFVQGEKKSWDFRKICSSSPQASFRIVVSNDEEYEHARDELQVFSPRVKVERMDCGHLSTLEKSDQIAGMIEVLSLAPEC